MKLHLFGYVISISRQNEKDTSSEIPVSKKKVQFESQAPPQIPRLRRDITDYGEVEGWLLTDEEERATKKPAPTYSLFDRKITSEPIETGQEIPEAWRNFKEPEGGIWEDAEPPILPRLIQALKEEREGIAAGVVLKKEVIKDGDKTYIRTIYGPPGYKHKAGGMASEVQGGCGE